MFTQWKFWNRDMSNIVPHGKHEEVAYEHKDLNVTAIFASLIGLALVGILIYFVVVGVYNYMEAYTAEHQPPANPMAPAAPADTRVVTPADIKNFSQPRLETNERLEINGFRLSEEQQLHSYGWVDQKAGTVRIPIDRAMQLIAQRGLPTTPKAGTTPPSEVNTVYQAAERADTSNANPAAQPSKEQQQKGKEKQ